MRRTVCLLAIALLVLPSLGSDAPKEYDGTTKRDDVQGTWEFVGFERDGKILPPAFSEWWSSRGGPSPAIIEGSLSCAGATAPNPATLRLISRTFRTTASSGGEASTGFTVARATRSASITPGTTARDALKRFTTR